MASNSDYSTELNWYQKLQLSLLRCCIGVLRLLGFRGLHKLGRLIGATMWHILPKRRKEAITAIEKHLQVTPDEAKHIAYQSFLNNAVSFLEIVLAKNFRLHDNPRLLPHSPEFEAMYNEKRPVVAVLGHIGAWELLAGILADFRQDYPRIVVVRNHRTKSMNVLIHELRSTGDGQSSVGHRNATDTIMKTLRSNGTAAFLVDHNSSRSEAIFLPFLGETAAVNFGPALLALRAKAMIYPIFLMRKKHYTYESIVLPPLDTEKLEGTIMERAGQIAVFYNKAVEKMVMEYPEQWFWMHKRWKTRPEGE